MPALQQQIMQKLYGSDIWDGFEPTEVSKDVQGWNGTHASLTKLASTTGEKIVVDVGVWKGQSTINMAGAMKRAGIDGVVISVDTFLGSPEHWAKERNLFTRRNGMPNLYATFMSNVFKAELTGYIVPMPQTSTTAAMILKKLGIRPSVVHVDAAHEYAEALRDAEDYWDLLQNGGFMIGDDYHQTWPGVIQAAGEFSARVKRPLTIEPPKWILQKP